MMLLHPATAAWGRRVRTGQVHVTTSFPMASQILTLLEWSPSAYHMRNYESNFLFTFFMTVIISNVVLHLSLWQLFLRVKDPSLWLGPSLSRNFPIPWPSLVDFYLLFLMLPSLFEMEGWEPAAVFKWQIFNQMPQGFVQWRHVVFWFVLVTFQMLPNLPFWLPLSWPFGRTQRASQRFLSPVVIANLSSFLCSCSYVCFVPRPLLLQPSALRFILHFNSIFKPSARLCDQI